MIRINLLPVSRRPVEEKIRREVSTFFLLVFLSIVVMAYLHVGHTRQIKKITAKKQKTDADIMRYRGRQKQLKALEQKQKVLDQKLKVIEDLRKNRDLPVRVLDELATRLPQDKIWFQKLTHSGNTLTIDGVARGNEVIAQFMETLAKSPYIDPDKVVLKQSRQVKLKGYKLKGFSLVCGVVVPAPPKKAPPQDSGKKKKKPKSA
jgi:type IV pilus assembly protein PilN